MAREGVEEDRKTTRRGLVKITQMADQRLVGFRAPQRVPMARPGTVRRMAQNGVDRVLGVGTDTKACPFPEARSEKKASQLKGHSDGPELPDVVRACSQRGRERVSSAAMGAGDTCAAGAGVGVGRAVGVNDKISSRKCGL